MVGQGAEHESAGHRETSPSHDSALGERGGTGPTFTGLLAAEETQAPAPKVEPEYRDTQITAGGTARGRLAAPDNNAAVVAESGLTAEARALQITAVGAPSSQPHAGKRQPHARSRLQSAESAGLCGPRVWNRAATGTETL